MHNFLSRDGTPPAEIYAAGRDEVARYGGTVENGRVTALSRDGVRFAVQAGSRAVTARRLLVATGLRDELPDVPGLAARWGVDVLHCAYCHGWEVRGQHVGLLATSPGVVHQALLFRQLSSQVTVLAHTGPALTDQQQDQFAALGITVIQGTVTQVEAGDGGLAGVRLADGTHVPLDALVVAPFLAARAELLAPLGLSPTEVRLSGHVIGTQIEADPSGATSVPGVWVAGNLANIQAQVITSAAAHGWQVTAADISSVALQRAAARAGMLGLDLTWLHADLSQTPAPGTYDLVTAHDLHAPKAVREPLLGHLARAVAPGGTLLVVGHDPTDMPRPHLAEMGWTAGELAGELGPDWLIETAEARPRQATDPEGRQVTTRDAVLRARRISAPGPAPAHRTDAATRTSR